MLRFAILILLLLLPVAASASKSQGAFWRSLLIPGWGQRYTTGEGGRFFAAELVFLGGYFGFERLGDIRREQYRAYAAEKAGAQPAGKGREYFDDLGFYQSRLEHNQFSRYKDGPNAKAYPLGRDSFWEWAGDPSRERYRSLRNSSTTAGRQAVFMTGLLVVNHLVSAVHAARTAGGAGDIRTTLIPSLNPGRLRASLAIVRHF
ncbi:MAG TPA: hypothetical protein EYQ18_25595 [Candidatus Handelsmanbacteria bacterium]|nr:hypothetical protein [Candidatus Handelsmanbacteria bacterium]